MQATALHGAASTNGNKNEGRGATRGHEAGQTSERKGAQCGSPGSEDTTASKKEEAAEL